MMVSLRILEKENGENSSNPRCLPHILFSRVEGTAISRWVGRPMGEVTGPEQCKHVAHGRRGERGCI